MGSFALYAIKEKTKPSFSTVFLIFCLIYGETRKPRVFCIKNTARWKMSSFNTSKHLNQRLKNVSLCRYNNHIMMAIPASFTFVCHLITGGGLDVFKAGGEQKIMGIMCVSEGNIRSLLQLLHISIVHED